MPKRTNIAQITTINNIANAVKNDDELIFAPPTPASFFYRILLYRIPPSI